MHAIRMCYFKEQKYIGLNKRDNSIIILGINVLNLYDLIYIFYLLFFSCILWFNIYIFNLKFMHKC